MTNITKEGDEQQLKIVSKDQIELGEKALPKEEPPVESEDGLKITGVISFEITLSANNIDYKIQSNLPGKLATLFSVRDEIKKLQDFCYSKEAKGKFTTTEKKNIISARFLLEKISAKMAQDVVNQIVKEREEKLKNK